jgi:hypothetical protein
MQQPPPTITPEVPAPPVAAPGPGPGSATIVLPDRTIQLGAPSTPQELAGLRERREILRDQLQRATNRREELVSQLNETGNPEARTGLHQRLILLDERILEIERDQAVTEQLLSNAPPEVLAMSREATRHTGGMDDDAAALLAFFAFGAGVLIAWFIGRIRHRRWKRKHVTAGSDDGRLDRLNQAVDAIAEEVERIGEGQRFVTQLLAQRRESASLPSESKRD